MEKMMTLRLFWLTTIRKTSFDLFFYDKKEIWVSMWFLSYIENLWHSRMSCVIHGSYTMKGSVSLLTIDSY